MNNLERYESVFKTIFMVSDDELINGFDVESVKKWDSITHLSLITAIEDEFDVMFDSDDILGLKSFEIGKQILAKYDVEL